MLGKYGLGGWRSPSYDQDMRDAIRRMEAAQQDTVDPKSTDINSDSTMTRNVETVIEPEVTTEPEAAPEPVVKEKKKRGWLLPALAAGGAVAAAFFMRD